VSVSGTNERYRHGRRSSVVDRTPAGRSVDCDAVQRRPDRFDSRDRVPDAVGDVGAWDTDPAE
jgi:hypothetical protein